MQNQDTNEQTSLVNEINEKFKKRVSKRRLQQNSSVCRCSCHDKELGTDLVEKSSSGTVDLIYTWSLRIGDQTENTKTATLSRK